MSKSQPVFPTVCCRRLETVAAQGGIIFWLEALVHSRALRDVPCAVAGAQGWTDGQMILSVLLLNLLGYERVADVELLEQEVGLRRVYRQYEPKLLGLSPAQLARRFRQAGGRRRCFPSESSLHDWLARFEDEEAAQARVTGTAVVPRPAAALQVLEEVNGRLMRSLVGWLGLRSLTLDLDATIVASGKRQALSTYRAATGQVPGERGYQPLLAFCPELGMVLGSEFRDGNVPASNGNLRLLRRVLEQLPESVTQVTLRSDGAAYQYELMDFCQNPQRRPPSLRRFGVIHFVLSARQAAEFRDEVQRTAGPHWQTVWPGVETASELECAELCYVPTWVVQRPESQTWRFVATRRELPGELGIGHDECSAQDSRPAYRVRGYLSNLPHPESPGAGRNAMAAADVVRFAQERCGHGEEIHAVLKRDMAGGMLPSGRFGANAAWWHLAEMAVNLTALLRRSGALGKHNLWARMKKLRQEWMGLKVQWVMHARKGSLGFAPSVGDKIQQALARIACIPAFNTS